MKRAVMTIAERLKDTIASWPTVECVTSGESAEQDIFSPYFALILDVYYRDWIPEPSARAEGFGAVGAFETSSTQSKDRFLVDGLPVRIEYKDMGGIERELESEALADALVEGGTYALHRLATWKLLFVKGDWIASVRRDLDGLGDDVWAKLRGAAAQKMEHCLADYGSAVWQEDPYFVLISAAGFLRHAAAALFAANRRFEPSDRFVSGEVLSLPTLPDSFKGNWESFLRSGPGETPERKFEIARFLAKSIIEL